MASLAQLHAVDLLSPSFWAALCPELTVSLTVSDAALAVPSPSITPQKTLRDSLVHHGFTRAPARMLWGGDGHAAHVRDTLISLLSGGVSALVSAGLHPSFIAVYDEAWALQEAVGVFLEHAMGLCSYKPLGDFAAFHVREGSHGWKPHRDRPSESALAGATDAVTGLPRYVTAWVPLTNASPESSCLYFLPRGADPFFASLDSPGACPLAAACAADASAFQSIVAMPLARGGLLTFGGRTIHWGSSPLPPAGPGAPAPPPRQALSFAFAHTDCAEASYLLDAAWGGVARSDGRPPSLAARVGLIAGQALVYHAQAPLSAASAALCMELFAAVTAVTEGEDAMFERAYVERVTAAGRWVEFTTAAAEAATAPRGAPSASEIALAFAAQAAAAEGLDAAAYL